MKRIDFNSRGRCWDAFRAFHIHTGLGFVQFETGEVICTRAKFDPHERGLHKEHDVYIVHPDDDVLRFMSDDGEPIPKAWLTQDGQQTLLFDPEYQEAIAFGTQYSSNLKSVAKHLSGGAIISMNSGCAATSDKPIILSSPFVATKESRQWLAEVKDLSGVTFELMRDVRGMWINSTKLDIDPAALKMSPQEFIDDTLKNKDGLFRLGQITKNGCSITRSVVKVPKIKAQLRR